MILCTNICAQWNSNMQLQESQAKPKLGREARLDDKVTRWDLLHCCAGFVWSRWRLCSGPGGLLSSQTHPAGQQSHQRARYDSWPAKTDGESSCFHYGGATVWDSVFVSQIADLYFTQTDKSHRSVFSLKELEMQRTVLEFDISLKAVSVLRYITDHTGRYDGVSPSS